MNTKINAVLVLTISLVILGCGSSQLFGPTPTETPTLTPSLVPTPSPVPTPSSTSAPAFAAGEYFKQGTAYSDSTAYDYIIDINVTEGGVIDRFYLTFKYPGGECTIRPSTDSNWVLDNNGSFSVADFPNSLVIRALGNTASVEYDIKLCESLPVTFSAEITNLRYTAPSYPFVAGTFTGNNVSFTVTANGVIEHFKLQAEDPCGGIGEIDEDDPSLADFKTSWFLIGTAPGEFVFRQPNLNEMSFILYISGKSATITSIAFGDCNQMLDNIKDIQWSP